MPMGDIEAIIHEYPLIGSLLKFHRGRHCTENIHLTSPQRPRGGYSTSRQTTPRLPPARKGATRLSCVCLLRSLPVSQNRVPTDENSPKIVKVVTVFMIKRCSRRPLTATATIRARGDAPIAVRLQLFKCLKCSNCLR